MRLRQQHGTLAVALYGQMESGGRVGDEKAVDGRGACRDGREEEVEKEEDDDE